MKKKIIPVIAAIIVLLALIVIGSSVYIVQENEYACVVRFSKIIDTKAEPGLYIKTPFLDYIKKFPKAIMYYDKLFNRRVTAFL